MATARLWPIPVLLKIYFIRHYHRTHPIQDSLSYLWSSYVWSKTDRSCSSGLFCMRFCSQQGNSLLVILLFSAGDLDFQVLIGSFSSKQQEAIMGKLTTMFCPEVLIAPRPLNRPLEQHVIISHAGGQNNGIGFFWELKAIFM